MVKGITFDPAVGSSFNLLSPVPILVIGNIGGQLTSGARATKRWFRSQITIEEKRVNYFQGVAPEAKQITVRMSKSFSRDSVSDLIAVRQSVKTMEEITKASRSISKQKEMNRPPLIKTDREITSPGLAISAKEMHA
ncbi:hypothetical protein JTE90_027423 [Oedothorax gibbosus]|uniref:Uncharacterized protein n=1 Tax=Oedothorax gibbosus TaxID=931172 RepID=A0AAV6W326_9ARAC|nr:hypothetical protein JTE90_027423 [Oedothorax gibbosus]